MSKEHLSRAAVVKNRVALVDPYVSHLLRNIEQGKSVLTLNKHARVFSQGESAQAIYFIQSGQIKLSVSSRAGKEVIVALLEPHDVLGEGCLIHRSIRISSATTIQPSVVFRLDRRTMLRALRDQQELSENFISCLLGRNIDLSTNLCDHLFNPAEKRLARILLKVSASREDVFPPAVKMPKLTQNTLAAMVGTTRARVTHLMTKFRRLGLIDYDMKKELVVRVELLAQVLSA